MRLPIITNLDIKKLNPYCFLIYSDNILESINILDLLARDNHFLQIIGVSYEPVDQAIYLFKERKNGRYICIKILGRYENWDLPSGILDLINFIDKPDFVIVDEEKDKEIFIGETTGTANVGNSQWQREGRKISAALKQIPMIYQTYYSGTDRSMFDQEIIDYGDTTGQVREPTSLQVINHFIYSLRYKAPSLVVYYSNPEYDKVLNFDRSNTGGKELFKNYVTLSLLNSFDSAYKNYKKQAEKNIYKQMLNYIIEPLNRRNVSLIPFKRIDKDFPVQPTNNILKNHGDEFIKYLTDYTNNDTFLKEDFDLIKWEFKTFFKWSHRYKGTRLLKYLAKQNLPLLSYLKIPTKVGFTFNTPKLVTLLINFYPKDRNKLIKKFNKSLPTLIVPTLMFQKKGKKFISKVDPGTGELVAFSELFAKDVKNQKSMNILVYVHVPGPREFSTNTKLFKAIKYYADCLIINERIYEIR